MTTISSRQPRKSTPVRVSNKGAPLSLNRYFERNGRLYYVVDFVREDGTFLIENCSTGLQFNVDNSYFGKEVNWLQTEGR